MLCGCHGYEIVTIAALDSEVGNDRDSTPVRLFRYSATAYPEAEARASPALRLNPPLVPSSSTKLNKREVLEVWITPIRYARSF